MSSCYFCGRESADPLAEGWGELEMWNGEDFVGTGNFGCTQCQGTAASGGTLTTKPDDFATSVANVSSREAVRALADVIAGQVGSPADARHAPWWKFWKRFQ